MRSYPYDAWRRRYGRRPYGRHNPPPFMRAMGCAFALLILAAATTGVVVSVLALTSGARTATIAVASAVATLIVAGFVATIGRLRRYFRQQERLRRQLMADVAHELRTPLSILQGRIEGLIDGVYARDDARLTELLTETQHLSRIVDDVRTLANAEAGALDLRKERIDLADIVRDAAAAVDVKVSVYAPATLVIDADPVRIREVLLNLLTNAVQHAPGGVVSISAEASGRDAVVVVRDDGPGIPADELPLLFERFHKGRDSRGSGLGLAIARRLVLAHDGHIDVTSREGAGTKVTVRLPL